MKNHHLSLRHLIIFGLVLSSVSAKSLLTQLLGLDFDIKGTEQRDAEDETAPTSNCVCDGPGCICCTDFNLTYIDLGGPGCVRLKYLSPEEGMAVNVSYGDSLLHSEVVKGPNPEPTCMNLLTDLAQICARFRELQPTSDGVRGCLNLEPRLLGESQADYELGCFRVGPSGMTFDPPANNTRPSVSASESKPASEKPDEAEEEEDEGPSDEEKVLAAVFETAEQGLAFLTSFLGTDLGGGVDESVTSAPTKVGESTGTASPSAESTISGVAPSSVSSTAESAASQGRAYSNPRFNEIF